jgi:hypothetical protein
MCVLSENLPAAGNYNETLTCGRGNGFFDKLREPLGSLFLFGRAFTRRGCACGRDPKSKITKRIFILLTFLWIYSKINLHKRKRVLGDGRPVCLAMGVTELN